MVTELINAIKHSLFSQGIIDHRIDIFHNTENSTDYEVMQLIANELAINLEHEGSVVTIHPHGNALINAEIIFDGDHYHSNNHIAPSPQEHLLHYFISLIGCS